MINTKTGGIVLTQKIERITAEIGKAHQKISELQHRIEELEQQKTALENTEIITLCRLADIPMKEIAAVLRSCKATGEPVPRPAPDSHAVPAGKEAEDV
jgi:septal ring factor EnvC (AmiA/AmiB activator)